MVETRQKRKNAPSPAPGDRPQQPSPPVTKKAKTASGRARRVSNQAPPPPPPAHSPTPPPPPPKGNRKQVEVVLRRRGRPGMSNKEFMAKLVENQAPPRVTPELPTTQGHVSGRSPVSSASVCVDENSTGTGNHENNDNPHDHESDENEDEEDDAAALCREFPLPDFLHQAFGINQRSFVHAEYQRLSTESITYMGKNPDPRALIDSIGKTVFGLEVPKSFDDSDDDEMKGIYSDVPSDDNDDDDDDGNHTNVDYNPSPLEDDEFSRLDDYGTWIFRFRDDKDGITRLRKEWDELSADELDAQFENCLPEQDAIQAAKDMAPPTPIAEGDTNVWTYSLLGQYQFTSKDPPVVSPIYTSADALAVIHNTEDGLVSSFGLGYAIPRPVKGVEFERKAHRMRLTLYQNATNGTKHLSELEQKNKKYHKTHRAVAKPLSRRDIVVEESEATSGSDYMADQQVKLVAEASGIRTTKRNAPDETSDSDGLRDEVESERGMNVIGSRDVDPRADDESPSTRETRSSTKVKAPQELSKADSTLRSSAKDLARSLRDAVLVIAQEEGHDYAALLRATAAELGFDPIKGAKVLSLWQLYMSAQSAKTPQPEESVSELYHKEVDHLSAEKQAELYDTLYTEYLERKDVGKEGVDMVASIHDLEEHVAKKLTPLVHRVDPQLDLVCLPVYWGENLLAQVCTGRIVTNDEVEKAIKRTGIDFKALGEMIRAQLRGEVLGPKLDDQGLKRSRLPSIGGTSNPVESIPPQEVESANAKDLIKPLEEARKKRTQPKFHLKTSRKPNKYDRELQRHMDQNRRSLATATLEQMKEAAYNKEPIDITVFIDNARKAKQGKGKAGLKDCVSYALTAQLNSVCLPEVPIKLFQYKLFLKQAICGRFRFRNFRESWGNLPGLGFNATFTEDQYEDFLDRMSSLESGLEQWTPEEMAYVEGSYQYNKIPLVTQDEFPDHPLTVGDAFKIGLEPGKTDYELNQLYQHWCQARESLWDREYRENGGRMLYNNIKASNVVQKTSSTSAEPGTLPNTFQSSPLSSVSAGPLPKDSTSSSRDYASMQQKPSHHRSSSQVASRTGAPSSISSASVNVVEPFARKVNKSIINQRSELGRGGPRSHTMVNTSARNPARTASEPVPLTSTAPIASGSKLYPASIMRSTSAPSQKSKEVTFMARPVHAKEAESLRTNFYSRKGKEPVRK